MELEIPKLNAVGKAPKQGSPVQINDLACIPIKGRIVIGQVIMRGWKNDEYFITVSWGDFVCDVPNGVGVYVRHYMLLPSVRQVFGQSFGSISQAREAVRPHLSAKAIIELGIA